MLYIHATIITVDQNRHIIRDGAIYVNENTITDLGKTDILLETILRGTADAGNKESWLADRIRPLQRTMTADDVDISAQLSIAEMLKSGTTCFLECMFFSSPVFSDALRPDFDKLCETVHLSGIRGCLARVSQSSKNPGLDKKLQSHTLEAWKKWNGAANDRIRVWFAASNIDFTTEAQMQQLCTVARSATIPITIHFSESRADSRYFSSLGHTASLYAEATGLLSSSTVFAHAVHVDKVLDIPKLASSGSHISHCPSSNFKLASGICPVPELLASGVNVSLAPDGAACNNSLDMLQEMKWASMIHKTDGQPAGISAETVLEMATINGAKALGLDHLIGSLEIGKKADFVALCFQKSALQPCVNPVSNIVYAATGRDVHLVVVDGQITVENGKLVTMDEEGIIKTANQALCDLLKRTNLDTQVGSQWPVL